MSPKQSRPRMVPVNFRARQETKDKAHDKAERLGINLTDVLRDFLEEWVAEEE